MVEKLAQRWSGRIALETLFRHSKSEDVYPVLHATDGVAYRLHRDGDPGSSRAAFAPFADQNVTLLGRADNLRGHWRIRMSAAECAAIALDPDPTTAVAESAAPDEASLARSAGPRAVLSEPSPPLPSTPPDGEPPAAASDGTGSARADRERS